MFNKDPRLFAIFCLFSLVLALVGCATTPPPVERVVIKEVPVPYHQPCPKASDLPQVPARVASETAVPRDAAGNTDWLAVSRVLGAKVLEWITYGEKADGLLSACSRPAAVDKSGN